MFFFSLNSNDKCNEARNIVDSLVLNVLFNLLQVTQHTLMYTFFFYMFFFIHSQKDNKILKKSTVICIHLHWVIYMH